jgi:hypothetical protein
MEERKLAGSLESEEVAWFSIDTCYSEKW